MNHPLFTYVLRLGDDSLILGQRLCEWSGRAPTIEVDLSLSNLALDLIGQATLLLTYAGEIEAAGRDPDRLAFHRDAEAFCNSLLVEQPNGDFAQTMARHLIFSSYQLAMFQRLQSCSDAHLSAIAAKALKEVQYHIDLATKWVIRLGGGTEESHNRLADGFDTLWRFFDDLFVTDSSIEILVKAGIAPNMADVREETLAILAPVLEKARITTPSSLPWQITGGRYGNHSEHLSRLLAEMQVLPRAHPEAIW